MESDNDDSRSSNSSESDSSNSPASPAMQSVDQFEKNKNLISNEAKENTEGNIQDDEEELELSDIEEEPKGSKQTEVAHEDLSDISDLESSNDQTHGYADLRHKLNKRRRNGSDSNEETVGKSDEELDFEEEEDLKDMVTGKTKESIESGSVKEDGEHKSDKDEPESGEELEDGEVTDGDEKRPEESEPKAVCRFFTRGQCTWGMSCRFLHPGTTDKGNYTMFELVRPMPHPPPMMMPAYDYRTERPPLHQVPHAESAWERGLRTAKEMMRKANKRKELDIDFDEKKMNLSGPPPDDIDPYYRGSPSELKERERVVERRIPPPALGYSPPAKYSRSGPSYYEEDQYGRMSRSYRELPAHRMPHYEDDDISKRRTVRTTTREVIVEKADDWNDPWMRKGDSGKSGKGRGRERSYSSNSSYSSSSSSTRSRSSSDTSPSPSRRRNERFEGQRSKERVQPVSSKIDRPKSRSSSQKRRHSDITRSKVPTMKKGPSPISAPKRKNPSSPLRGFNKHKKKNSSSGSSSGSESGSESESSSSSNKAKKRREKIVSERKVSTKKGDGPKKIRSPPPQKDSDEKLNEKASAAAKLKSSRREELLKQLRAVEDAIARKRSKIA